MIDVVLCHDLVVNFTREGELVERFHCADGREAWRITLIVIATYGDVAGDLISVEQRRRLELD